MKYKEETVNHQILLHSIPYLLLVGCAQLTPESVNVSPKVLSRYVLPNGLPLHDTPVMQTDVTVRARSGLYANVFHSVGLDDHDLSSNGGDELDYTVGWYVHLLPAELAADVSLSYLDLINLLEVPSGDLLAPSGELNYALDRTGTTFTPYARLSAYIPTSGDAGKSTAFGTLGLRHEWPLTSVLTLLQRADVTYDNGRLSGTDHGWLLGYALTASWKLSEVAGIDFPGVRLSLPLTRFGDRNEEAILWAGLTLSLDP